MILVILDLKLNMNVIINAIIFADIEYNFGVQFNNIF